jgi:hypothetical protein
VRRDSFVHEFVEYVPKDPQEGILYVSIRFHTVVHRCACGCGTKIATPLSPANWQITYDGESISICPSIGGWTMPCRSHYWIRSNRVRWAEPWTDAQIAAGRSRDDDERAQDFARRSAASIPAAEANAERWITRWLRRFGKH